MRKKLKRGFVLTGAILFILIGLVGLLLPFLQGILFIAIGLLLLSLVVPQVRTFLDRHTVRYPRVHRIVLDAERWVVRVVGEI
jgi:uncharacterized protein YqgC (DUF456 family)